MFSQISLSFFPFSSFHCLWAKKENKPPCQFVNFMCNLRGCLCPALKGRRGGKKGWTYSPSLTFLGLWHQSSVYMAEGLGVLEWREGTTWMIQEATPPPCSYFPAGLSAALSSKREMKSAKFFSVIWRHLFPFLFLSWKLVFNKHNKTDNRGYLQEQIHLSSSVDLQHLQKGLLCCCSLLHILKVLEKNEGTWCSLIYCLWVR